MNESLPTMDEAKKPSNQAGLLTRVSRQFVTGMEELFFWHGRSVSSHPVLYIVLCFLFTAICCLGFVNFTMESRPEKLWIPQDSDYVLALEWQTENFPNSERVEMALFEAENVLTPTVVQEIYRVYRQVADITVTDEFGRPRNQTHLCFKVPVLSLAPQPQLQNEKTDVSKNMMQKDWSLFLNSQLYCKVRNIIPEACLEIGILDIWGDNPESIAALTQQDIVNDINTATLSATYLYPMNFSQFLGSVERNSTGHIVSAGATLHQWFMRVNRTAVEQAAMGGMAGLDAEVDDALLAWEGELIKVLQNTTGRPTGVTLYFSTERSFGEISGDTILGDVMFLALGNAILFMYVTMMLGRFNVVEQRPLLSLLGLLSTFMAVGISFGLCSAFKLPYGPVHSILPLLMLGLGVDDMFVIVQCWSNLPQQERARLVLQDQVGRAMQHAGVAITVTSLTDMLAFAIGSSTALPALRSFCIYSAVGIVALYMLQSTFFVAWFTLDQARMNDQRNGLLWCYRHKGHVPNKCSQVDLCQTFFKKFYSKNLLSTHGKVGTVVLTAVVLGVSIWGVTNLRQEFNPVWFIPQSSYLFQFLSKTMSYFPEAGSRGNVFLGALDYPAELPKLHSLTKAMVDDPDISSVDSWYTHLVDYTFSDTQEDIAGKALNETYFNSIMGKFIFSPSGSRFQSYFNFDGNISCGSSIPTILASKFDFQHDQLDGRNEQIDAMDRTKAMVAAEQFSDFAAPVAMSYSSWETDKVIAAELLRNLALALVAVLLMTLLLIASLPTALCVFFCVALTLVDVMALMTWWGLTIDTVSCINLVLCIGLCVDYSAHIGLHFMQVQGTRDERVRLTLMEMGPAVLNGAFSTFLAFVLLANSDSHVFESFFKIFFGVFVFGVYHGLVFLPVVLSLVGPASYITVDHLVGDSKGDVEGPLPHGDQDQAPASEKQLPYQPQHEGDRVVLGTGDRIVTYEKEDAPTNGET